MADSLLVPALCKMSRGTINILNQQLKVAADVGKMGPIKIKCHSSPGAKVLHKEQWHRCCGIAGFASLPCSTGQVCNPIRIWIRHMLASTFFVSSNSALAGSIPVQGGPCGKACSFYTVLTCSCCWYCSRELLSWKVSSTSSIAEPTAPISWLPSICT